MKRHYQRVEPKIMLYRFVLFYDIPWEQLEPLMNISPYEEGDNAVLTYCYVDQVKGLRFRFVCLGRQYVSGQVALRDLYQKDSVTMDFNEDFFIGGVRLLTFNPAEPEVECFREIEAEIVLKYGHDEDLKNVREDIWCDKLRHPIRKDEILVTFTMTGEETISEKLWVRETNSNEEFIEGILLNEPDDPIFGSHKGDTVRVVKYEFYGEHKPVGIPKAAMETFGGESAALGEVDWHAMAEQESDPNRRRLIHALYYR